MRIFLVLTGCGSVMVETAPVPATCSLNCTPSHVSTCHVGVPFHVVVSEATYSLCASASVSAGAGSPVAASQSVVVRPSIALDGTNDGPRDELAVAVAPPVTLCVAVFRIVPSRYTNDPCCGDSVPAVHDRFTVLPEAIV